MIEFNCFDLTGTNSFGVSIFCVCYIICQDLKQRDMNTVRAIIFTSQSLKTSIVPAPMPQHIMPKYAETIRILLLLFRKWANFLPIRAHHMIYGRAGGKCLRLFFARRTYCGQESHGEGEGEKKTGPMGSYTHFSLPIPPSIDTVLPAWPQTNIARFRRKNYGHTDKNILVHGRKRK